jgi:hypothetical protein
VNRLFKNFLSTSIVLCPALTVLLKGCTQAFTPAVSETSSAIAVTPVQTEPETETVPPPTAEPAPESTTASTPNPVSDGGNGSGTVLTTPPAGSIEAELYFSDLPLLNIPIQVSLTFALRERYNDADDAVARIRLDECNLFDPVDSDIEWHGDVLKGETYQITATVKVVKTGVCEMVGSVGYKHSPSDWFGGSAHTWVIVKETSAEDGRVPTMEDWGSPSYKVPGRSKSIPSEGKYPPTPRLTDEDWERIMNGSSSRGENN